MLVLRTLRLGPAPGHAIERGSGDVLQIEHGSLYPALHRLENRGWIASFWDTSENNRKAKYYRLTPRRAETVDRADDALGASRSRDRTHFETHHGVNQP